MLAAAVQLSRTSKPVVMTPKQHIIECEGPEASNFNCWEERFAQTVREDSPKVAFADMRKEYETSEFMQSNCHQLVHVIGRTAAERYTDVIAAYNEGDNFCWSGYYHGVMEKVIQQIGYANIQAQINQICQPARQQEYSFYHYNCVHGLGHGLMLINDNQLFDSLKNCDGLEGTWQQEGCHGGVFMENVMSEINPNHETTFFKADDPLYPCTAVEDRYKTQCYLMQTSHALNVLSRDYNKVFELCSGVPGEYANICYQSLGRDISGNSVSSATTTKQLCMQGKSTAARENCIIGAVKDFISYHHSDKQGLELCNSLEDESLKSTCLSTAQTYYQTF